MKSSVPQPPVLSTDVLVVGAGPAGLSLAYHLERDTLVVEMEAEVGGLCRSIEKDGGVFDIGGHSFHTPHTEVRELVEEIMEGRWHSQQRDARVYSHGTLIPYPFQRNFEQIADQAVVEECRRGLETAGGVDEAADFEEYLIRRFGDGIARHFMLPYNRKLWARDLRKISCEWTSERVAAAQDSERFDESGGKRKPLQPDTVVGYPADGGFVEIFRSLACAAGRILTNERIIKIDPVEKRAYSATGTVIAWETLVSTMPLPVLLSLVEGTPDELRRSAARLEAMSLNLLMLLIDDPLPDAPHRIYSADPDVPPHKVAFNHTSSSALRDRPVHAVMAEISYSEEKPLPPRSELESRTIQFFIDTGLLRSGSQVRWCEHLDVPYAYPVYTHERPGILSRIKKHLAGQGIHTLGRFGEWKYVNSDRCIKGAMDLASELRR